MSFDIPETRYARSGFLTGAGEILVSGTVKSVVIGAGIDFADRGRHEIEGLPGEWQVWSAT